MKPKGPIPKKKTKIEGLEKIKAHEIEIDDMFKPKPVVSEYGGMEKVKHNMDLLQMEWTIKHPEKSPTAFLSEVKGYRQAQIRYIFSRCPPEEFKKSKQRIMDQLTASMVKRHVDIMARNSRCASKG